MTTRAFMYINAATSILALSFLFWLIYLRRGGGDAATLAFLPAVNAALNATTSAFLIRGWFAIKAGNRELHAFCQKTAFVFSALFLVCYILYHSVHGDSHFTGQGMIRGVYFFILISHIILSMAALPMVLATFFFALDGQWARHRKLARLTFPIWLYVSITGVLVFAFLKSAGV
jgi:putative membrane protein